MSKHAVVYCVTGKHIQLTAVSVTSVINNYKGAHLDILIIVQDVTEKDMVTIKQIPVALQKENVTIYFWNPPEEIKEIKNYQNNRFPEVTLWRLFVPAYFSSYNKILYLDNDTIVYEDVEKLFPLVPQEKAIAAIRDFYFSAISDDQDYGKQFGVATMKNYVNSGVILFNVETYNNLITTNKFLEMINENKYQYLDQTILNILCEESMTFLPYEYNYQKDDHWLFDWAQHKNERVANLIIAARENVKIRHFVEFEKHSMPWEHVTVQDQWEKDFWKYLYVIKEISMILQ